MADYRVMEAAKVTKKRGISVTQRQSLRRYAQQHPHIRQHALREWFRTEFQRDINQSTVSESPSAKFSHLDSDQGRLQRTQQREKAIRWPELDKALIK
ncbi:hypothetical protein OnM2_052085, partial [Erysiphe neolycopersici]